MDNLLNKDLKVKLDCFKKQTQTELFRDIDGSMGVFLVSRQAVFINYCSLVGDSLSASCARGGLIDNCR